MDWWNRRLPSRRRPRKFNHRKARKRKNERRERLLRSGGGTRTGGGKRRTGTPQLQKLQRGPRGPWRTRHGSLAVSNYREIERTIPVRPVRATVAEIVAAQHLPVGTRNIRASIANVAGPARNDALVYRGDRLTLTYEVPA